MLKVCKLYPSQSLRHLRQKEAGSALINVYSSFETIKLRSSKAVWRNHLTGY